MRTKAQTVTVITLAATLMAGQAQTTPSAATTSAAPPPPSPLQQTIQDIKKPVSWLTWGADLRVRDEHFDNLLTLDNPNPALPPSEQDYLRFRARIYASIMPVEDVSINVRLANEAREWLKQAGYTPFSPRSGLDMREGIFDSLNIQWRNILKQPLTATIGRQDILLGDGWLTGDGTPFDGSWTYFLDAARFTYQLKEQKTTIEAIGIIQDAKDDAWLPTINNQNLYLTEQDEKGAILWVANKSMPEANLDAYFMYKHDDAVSTDELAPRFRADSADIYTLGARVSGVVAEHWKYSVEGAYQFGEKQDPSIVIPSVSTDFRDLRAFGVNGKVAYSFKDKLNNQLGFAYEFLSGDDPDTDNDEMFDNLWGRWPRWSEIGLYSYATETRIGNQANVHRFGPTWSLNPIKNMDFSASYYALFSQYDVATRGLAGSFSGSGNFRGHFVQAVLKYKFSKHLSGHLWSEFQFPGDYYAHRPAWYFLRPELMLTF